MSSVAVGAGQQSGKADAAERGMGCAFNPSEPPHRQDHLQWVQGQGDHANRGVESVPLGLLSNKVLQNQSGWIMALHRENPLPVGQRNGF